MQKFFLFLAIMAGSIASVQATVWNIGASRTYTLPSQVKDLVQNGDTIYIDGGVYANDATKWMKKNLKIIGLGTNNNRTILRYTGNIPNGKGIFVFDIPNTCDNAWVENIVFDGAQVSDTDGGNGAGIRFQATNLTVKNCKFMNCQNGILEGHNSVNSSNIIILDSEFENNGYQLPNNASFSGYEHPIYISASTDTLVVQHCYFHNPRGQANSLKTRAQRSYILYNLIDENEGYGSWEINIAQGGLNIIMGNIIIQGAMGANHGIVGYDAATNPLEDFYFINNTVINKFVGNVKYFNIIPSGINTFKVYNNIFASVSGASNTLFAGNIPTILNAANNTAIMDYASFGFTNPAQNDYSLLATATAAINNGAEAGTTNEGFILTPTYSYQSLDTDLLPRIIQQNYIDIGAYEYSIPNPTHFLSNEKAITFFPNPSAGKMQCELSKEIDLQEARLEIYNVLGQRVYKIEKLSSYRFELNLSDAISGLYYVRLTASNQSYTYPVIIE